MSKAGSFIFILGTPEGIFRNDRVALHVHQRLFGGVDGNPVQPGVELGVATELVQRPIGANEGFLGNVLDQVRVTHHASDKSLDATLVLDDQQFIGALVARYRALHQLEIAVFGGGRRNYSHGYSGFTPCNSLPGGFVSVVNARSGARIYRTAQVHPALRLAGALQP